MLPQKVLILKSGQVGLIDSNKLYGENMLSMIRWGALKADFWLLGGRQDLGQGSTAGQGAASKWQEIASYWPPGRREAGALTW